jgi:hypothetical protein
MRHNTQTIGLVIDVISSILFVKTLQLGLIHSLPNATSKVCVIFVLFELFQTNRKLVGHFFIM